MARLALTVIAFGSYFVCAHAAPGCINKYHSQPDMKNINIAISKILPKDYNAISIFSFRQKQDNIDGDYNKENDEHNVKSDDNTTKIGKESQDLDHTKATPDNSKRNKSTHRSNKVNVKKGGNVWPIFSRVDNSEDYTTGITDHSSDESHSHDNISHKLTKCTDNNNKNSIRNDESKRDEDQNNSEHIEEQNYVNIKPLPYWDVVRTKDDSADLSVTNDSTGSGESCNSSNCYRHQSKQGSYWGKGISVGDHSKTKEYYHKEDISYSDRHYQRSYKTQENNYKPITEYFANNKQINKYHLLENTRKVFDHGMERLKNLLSISNNKNYRKRDFNHQDDADRGSKQNSRHGKGDGKPSNNKKSRYYRRKGGNNSKYKNRGSSSYHNRRYRNKRYHKYGKSKSNTINYNYHKRKNRW